MKIGQRVIHLPTGRIGLLSGLHMQGKKQCAVVKPPNERFFVARASDLKRKYRTWRDK